MAWHHDRPVFVVGHQKGRDTNQKIFRNFGMPKPEGYRKAMRVMRLAEKFRRPLFAFVDTPEPTRASTPRNVDRRKRSRTTSAKSLDSIRPSW